MYRFTAFTADHATDIFKTDTVPFEAYSLAVSVFVVEKATNSSIPIVKFAVGDSPDNFFVSSTEDREVLMSPFIYDPGTGPTEISAQSSVIDILVKKSQFAQALTICMFIINWALTVGSVYITLVVTFRKEGGSDAILLLPVTIILTIPTLRNLYVGSPPFGVLIGKSRALRSQIPVRVLTLLSDTFGFFLQMVIVAVCSMVLVYYAAILKPASEWRASHGNGNT